MNFPFPTNLPQDVKNEFQAYHNSMLDDFTSKVRNYYSQYTPRQKSRSNLAEDVHFVYNANMVHAVARSLQIEKEQMSQFEKQCTQTNWALDIPWFPFIERTWFDGRRIPHPYQSEDVEKILFSNHPFVANYEMGLGKTTLGLMVASHTYNIKEAKPILIVAPKSVVAVWEQEILEYYYPASVSQLISDELDEDFFEHQKEEASLEDDLEDNLEEDNLKEEEPFPKVVLQNSEVARFVNLFKQEAYPEKEKRQIHRVFLYVDGNRSQKCQKHFSASKTEFVITTYDILRRDVESDAGFLPNVHFSLVILDEAHLIRGNTARSKAALHLVPRSDNRLCLSGTCYVNSDNDLYSLAKFLNHGPTKDRISQLNRVKDREGSLEEWISNYMCIRKKADVNIQLPSKHMVVSHLRFGPMEWMNYKQGIEDIRELVRGHDNLRMYSAEILAKILYLRQLCLSVMLVKEPETIYDWYFKRTPIDDARMVRAVKECTKLKTVIKDIYMLAYQFVDASDFVQQPHQSKEDDNNDRRVKELMGVMPSNPIRTHSNERIVVTTESKRSIYFLTMALVNESVRSYLDLSKYPVPKILTFTGDLVSTKKRSAVLKEFNTVSMEKPEAVIFLMTRVCGGLGINLSKSRHLVMVDRWWNDAASSQVIDRIHRIGQVRPVYIHQYPLEGSIEQYLWLVESRKKNESLKFFGNSVDQELARMRYEALQKKWSRSEDPESGPGTNLLRRLVKFLQDFVFSPDQASGTRVGVEYSHVGEKRSHVQAVNGENYNKLEKSSMPMQIPASASGAISLSSANHFQQAKDARKHQAHEWISRRSIGNVVCLVDSDDDSSIDHDEDLQKAHDDLLNLL